MTTRREHDLLGDRDVPADAYYGVHTLRAIENFPITGTRISIYPDLIAALASIKSAAARSNHELGLLDVTRTDAIVAAAEEIRAGKLHEQFVVDVIQGGAGTSTNMNANEVIANRALELLGHPKGDYKFLHPNEHVNMSQSTNDVYPTALKLAAYAGIMQLVDAMAVLRQSFEAKSETACDVGFFLAYEFKSRTLAMLMGTMFDTAFQRFAAAFEKRADAIYGKPSAGVQR
jgi:aspartate ammonia-lyase